MKLLKRIWGWVTVDRCILAFFAVMFGFSLYPTGQTGPLWMTYLVVLISQFLAMENSKLKRQMHEMRKANLDLLLNSALLIVTAAESEVKKAADTHAGDAMPSASNENPTIN